MQPAAGPGLGASALQRYLDGDLWSLRNELRRLLGGCPLFRHRYDLSLDEMRALTFQRVKFTMGLPLLKRAIQGQAEKMKNFVSRSLVIGEFLSVADMATGVKCEIIDWLFGGVARSLGSPDHVAKWLQPLQGSTVSSYLRDENGSLYPGVTVIDMMYKEGGSPGLHGVDNEILVFDKVQVPRENLLDSRRQFGPKAKEEVRITEHQTQTLQLMPHLAMALALTFVSRCAGVLLDEDIFYGKELVGSRPLQALVAGLKACSTWENVNCLQDCPECTGVMVVSKKEESFSAWNACLHHAASLSLAHIHREQLSLAVKNCSDQEDQALLMKFCLLYGTKLVFQEQAWYLEHKYLTPRPACGLEVSCWICATW